MNSLGGITGIGSSPGAQGLGWSPSAVGLQMPVTEDQNSTAYNQSQSGIANQQAFMQALQAQNGIGNQSSVYGQLAGVANGTGPNPAQAALNQATGANVANQAALMAGQRGAGANAGLIARQAALQGGNIQQQAAGQGATMQAQQQLAALGQMGNIAGQQVQNQANATGALTGAQQSEQGMLLNSVNQYNQANVAQNNSMNTASGAQATAGGKQGGGGLGAVFSSLAAGGEVKKYASGGPTNAPPPPSAPTNFGQRFQANYSNSLNNVYSTPNQQQQDQGSSQLYGSIAKGIKSLFNSKSTSTPPSQELPGENDWAAYTGAPGTDLSDQNASMMGGSSTADAATGAGTDAAGADAAGAAGSDAAAGAGTDAAASEAAEAGIGSEIGELAAFAAHGGKVPAKVSPGERYLDPSEVQKVAEGKKSPIKAGEKIPGKAKVKGDDLKNDTVSKTLQEGGIVLPRSVTESKDAPKKAAAFVAAILKKQAMSRG